jgi:hypothetical protein
LGQKSEIKLEIARYVDLLPVVKAAKKEVKSADTTKKRKSNTTSQFSLGPKSEGSQELKSTFIPYDHINITASNIKLKTGTGGLIIGTEEKVVVMKTGTVEVNKSDGVRKCIVIKSADFPAHEFLALLSPTDIKEVNWVPVKEWREEKGLKETVDRFVMHGNKKFVRPSLVKVTNALTGLQKNKLNRQKGQEQEEKRRSTAEAKKAQEKKDSDLETERNSAAAIAAKQREHQRAAATLSSAKDNEIAQLKLQEKHNSEKHAMALELAQLRMALELAQLRQEKTIEPTNSNGTGSNAKRVRR